jgi:ribosomal protein S19E (S16A)
MIYYLFFKLSNFSGGRTLSKQGRRDLDRIAAQMNPRK